MPSKKRKHVRNTKRGRENRSALRKQILDEGVGVIRRGKSSRAF